MKNDNLGGFFGGLVGLAVSIFVVGYAWRMSQSRKSGFIPGASSEPGAAPTLQPVAMQPKIDASRNQNGQSDNIDADGFFDGVYN